MKMNIVLALVVALFASPYGASAGPGHSHGAGGHTHEKAIDEAAAKKRSEEELDRLTKAGKLEASWSKAKYVSTEKKNFKGKDEWVSVFKNEAASDPKKKDLFVFLSGGGKFIAANHTGK